MAPSGAAASPTMTTMLLVAANNANLALPRAGCVMEISCIAKGRRGASSPRLSRRERASREVVVDTRRAACRPRIESCGVRYLPLPIHLSLSPYLAHVRPTSHKNHKGYPRDAPREARRARSNPAGAASSRRLSRARTKNRPTFIIHSLWSCAVTRWRAMRSR